MTISAPPPGLQPEDYEEIEAAVMETARGRWFLAEFARRVRADDAGILLAAIERIEARLEAKGALAAAESFNVADRLSELSWSLRERGVEDFVCGKIDALAREFSGGGSVRPQGGDHAAPADARVETPLAEAPPAERDAFSTVAPAAPARDPQAARDAWIDASPRARNDVEDDSAAPPAPVTQADPPGFAREPEAAVFEPSHKLEPTAANAESPPPVDPRLAALSWLDRLPLVDRMALFA